MPVRAHRSYYAVRFGQLRFEFFQFPIAAHPSEHCGEREDDHSENVQTNSDNKDKDKMHWKAPFRENASSTLLCDAYLRCDLGNPRRGGSRQISPSCRSCCVEGNTRAGSDVRLWG